MSLKKKILVLLLLCLTALGLAGCGNAAMIINGEEVPQSVIDYYVNAGKVGLESYGIDMESEDGAQYLPMIEQQAVTSCEQMAVIRSAAKEKGLEVTEEDVTEEFEIEKQAFESEDAYNEFLETNDLEEDTIKWIIESQLYYQALFDEVNKDLVATDEEIKAAYEKNPTAFDSVKVSYILIQPEDTSSDEAWATAETEAKEVISELNNGGDFAALAKEHSDDASTKDNGGVLEDSFTAESEAYVSEFVTAAVGLTEVGSYTTEPVKSESFGYFIIKLDEKITGWENLKEEIDESLMGDQRNENFSTFMTEAMENAVYDKEYKYQYTEETTTDESTDTENTDDTASQSTEDETGDTNENDADTQTDSQSDNATSSTEEQ